MKSVLIVCEAGAGNGLGHFYRSVALAQMLFENYRVQLLANNPDLEGNSILPLVTVDTFENYPNYTDFDLIVLDGYHFDDRLIHPLIQLEIPLVEVSDFGHQLYPTSFWINTSINEQTAPGKGLSFSLLRPKILDIARNRTFSQQSTERIFIAFGGTDEQSNTLKTVETLLATRHFQQIGALYPPKGIDSEALNALCKTYPELTIHSNLSVEVLVQTLNDYGVCLVSSSTIACEMIALRRLVFTVCLYENQTLLHEQLTENGAAFELQLSELSQNPSSFLVKLDTLSNPEAQQTLFEQQKTLIDGNAASRMRKFIANCFT